MAPAQPFVDADLKSGPQYSTIAAEKENRGFLANMDRTGLSCMTNCEYAISGMEAFLQKHTKAPEVLKDMDIDIIEIANTKNTRSTEAEDPDATECSSSFGDTVSETGDCSEFGEVEVESQFCGDNNFASAFESFRGVFPIRKKKLTNHWRRFIRPLMWRCKWTELRIKQIESQALSYARKLAAYGPGKPMELDPSTLEVSGSKSLPISSQNPRKKAMKRKKRKRIEETIDIASYMSHHSLFSYFENKMSTPDGASTADDFGNSVFVDSHDENDEFGMDDNQSFLKIKNGENSLEWILYKIEIALSRVHKLKSQVDNVISEHAAKFSSSENLSLLGACDAQTSSAPSATFSAGNGDTVSAGAIYASTQATQLISEYDTVNLVMHESVASDYGGAIHVPDIIESTMGLLSTADVTLPHPQIGDSCEAILDNVLIHNQTAEVERQSFQNMTDQPTEKHKKPMIGEQDESINPSVIPALEPDLKIKTATPQEQSTLKSSLASEFHFPTNKRKRGERKAGSGGWSRKNSGEPDS